MSAVLNIGNTTTEVSGLRPSPGEAGIVRVSTASLLEGAPPVAVVDALGGACLAACVVPAVRDRLRILAAGRGPLVFLQAGLVCEVDFHGVDASTLGADRVANAVALAARSPGPGMVLDCGTCITTEAVDAERRFLGGAILPGRQLARRALREYTGQLPLVPLAEDVPGALGRCTVDAIRAGIDSGVLGAVLRLLEQGRQALGDAFCPVWVVGGDGPFFLRHLPGLRAAPAGFTLEGVRIVARRLFGDGPG
ncbi:MAG: type III pantothenate kinase [Lentisphaeria bacterium]|nr:type III pantothenate kinase [Lentisphaeria bacterium]